eukprot:6183989-Pleurochrysis_carterae.AAC.3
MQAWRIKLSHEVLSSNHAMDNAVSYARHHHASQWAFIGAKAWTSEKMRPAPTQLTFANVANQFLGR